MSSMPASSATTTTSAIRSTAATTASTICYGAITPLTTAVVVSGTNLDDLGDYRPGLGAARENEVRHPFVDAGIDKATVRAIARELRLDDLAELPAAPCLSSRIETGIVIDAAGAVGRAPGRSASSAQSCRRRPCAAASGPTA